MTNQHNAKAYALYQQGIEFKNKGDMQNAYMAFKEAIELEPHIPPYHLNLALVAIELAKPLEVLHTTALFHAQQAAQIAPNVLANWLALGEVALNCNKFPEAIAAYEHAMTVDNTNARMYGTTGFAYDKMGNHDKARGLYEKAISIDPDLGDVHFLLSCLFAGENYNPNKQAYHGEQGFKCKMPAKLSVESRWNSAHGFLGSGNYEKGFEYFEARLEPSIMAGKTTHEKHDKPHWNGQTHVNIEGTMLPATVRIVSEMGFGDAFFMARFLPQVQAMGVKVIFLCLPHMFDLMKYNFPDIDVVLCGEDMNRSFDYWLPMMSLPHVLKVKEAYWPVNYIKAEPEISAIWRSILPLAHKKPNIGICWAGGKRAYNAENSVIDGRRSLNFAQIQPLLDNKNINFISLQTERHEGFETPGIKTFSDTAAIIEQLDFVISVDSAVANLAGAMGKPLLLIDRYDHCWRWYDTKWFPHTKIYRQAKLGDWSDVIEKLVFDLNVISGNVGKAREHAA